MRLRKVGSVCGQERHFLQAGLSGQALITSGWAVLYLYVPYTRLGRLFQPDQVATLGKEFPSRVDVLFFAG